MAKATNRVHCITCGKEKSTFKCGGCLQEFCFNHLEDHKQELNKKFDEIEVNCDLVRQTLIEQTSQPEKHTLIQQINQWENDSINKIRQTAEETRQIVLKHIIKYDRELETKLNKLTEQLRQHRKENDFYETDLHQWNEVLTRLTKELTKPSNINLRQDSTLFVTKISVDIIPASFNNSNIDANARWVQNGITIAGGHGKGNALNQLASPCAICIDDDQTIYIADCANHRIVEWKNAATCGRVVAGGNEQGNRVDQLNRPTDVIVDKEMDSFIICDHGNRRIVQWPRQNGTSGQIIISDIDCSGLTMDNDRYLYVSDYIKHEVRRWQIGDANGELVAGGNGLGNHLNQLNRPTHIFVDANQSVYVSDENNDRVMKWIKGAKDGIVVAGGHGQGNSLTHLYRPYEVFVDQSDTVYIADSGNARIIRCPKGLEQGSIIIGKNEHEKQTSPFKYPVSLSFDSQANLYVVDYLDHRVQKFNIDSTWNS